MKKHIKSIILCGFVSFFVMGIQAQNCKNDNDLDNSANTPVEIIKGTVIDFNNDGVWDFVTFGLDGPASYKVSTVELGDENGNMLVEIGSFSSFSKEGEAWYVINLNDIKTPMDFTLRVHVVKHKASKTDGSDLSATAAGTGTTALPLDPEETILIVKYP